MGEAERKLEQVVNLGTKNKTIEKEVENMATSKPKLISLPEAEYNETLSMYQAQGREEAFHALFRMKGTKDGFVGNMRVKYSDLFDKVDNALDELNLALKNNEETHTYYSKQLEKDITELALVRLTTATMSNATTAEREHYRSLKAHSKAKK